MVTLQLSDDEARILAHLLEGAANEFSNHGCNDFNVETELGLPKERAIALAHELRLSMVKLNVADDEYAADHTSVYLFDWMLYHLFRKKVLAASKGVPLMPHDH